MKAKVVWVKKREYKWSGDYDTRSSQPLDLPVTEWELCPYEPEYDQDCWECVVMIPVEE